MHRFYHPEQISSPCKIILTEEASNHLARVLRLKVQEPVSIFNGDEYDYHGIIQSIDKKKVTINIETKTLNICNPKIHISLLQSVTSKEKIDMIFQKSTELGISSLQLIDSERSNFRIPDHKIDSRLEHLRKVVISACEQSGRSRIPTINNRIISFSDIEKSSENVLKFILDPQAHQSLGKVEFNKIENIMNILLLIGPEGGFTNSEIIIANKLGFQSINLGKRVLRTETASLAMLSAMHMLFGDFV